MQLPALLGNYDRPTHRRDGPIDGDGGLKESYPSNKERDCREMGLGTFRVANASRYNDFCSGICYVHAPIVPLVLFTVHCNC